jgi:hypothetical protein
MRLPVFMEKHTPSENKPYLVPRAPQRGLLPGSQWSQYLPGFGLGVLGLFPYLGKVIPLFSPMLAILPEAIQPVAIPLSATGMGITAIALRWYLVHNVKKGQLKQLFRPTVLTCGIAFLVFVAIEVAAVVRIDVPAVNRTVSFAVGPKNPGNPPCSGLSRADCIKHRLSLDEAVITSYYGDGWVTATNISLTLDYTLLMSTLGALLILFRRERQRKAGARVTSETKSAPDELYEA